MSLLKVSSLSSLTTALIPIDSWFKWSENNSVFIASTEFMIIILILAYAFWARRNSIEPEKSRGKGSFKFDRRQYNEDFLKALKAAETAAKEYINDQSKKWYDSLSPKVNNFVLERVNFWNQIGSTLSNDEAKLKHFIELIEQNVLVPEQVNHVFFNITFEALNIYKDVFLDSLKIIDCKYHIPNKDRKNWLEFMNNLAVIVDKAGRVFVANSSVANSMKYYSIGFTAFMGIKFMGNIVPKLVINLGWKWLAKFSVGKTIAVILSGAAAPATWSLIAFMAYRDWESSSEKQKLHLKAELLEGLEEVRKELVFDMQNVIQSVEHNIIVESKDFDLYEVYEDSSPKHNNLNDLEVEFEEVG